MRYFHEVKIRYLPGYCIIIQFIRKPYVFFVPQLKMDERKCSIKIKAKISYTFA